MDNDNMAAVDENIYLEEDFDFYDADEEMLTIWPTVHCPNAWQADDAMDYWNEA